MSANKYLVDAGAYDQEVAATQTSTGAPNANEIVALNADGVLDPTLMPPGIVPMLTIATASEALAAGDFVNLWNDTGTLKARKADASVPNVAKKADGYVRDNYLINAIDVKVYVEDFNDKVSGLTVGSDYFLSDTVPGGVTATAPTTAGYISQYLGAAVSATKMIVEMDRPTLRA